MEETKVKKKIHYCEVCHKQFVPYREFHKRCSNKCRLIATEKDNRYVKKEIKKKKCKHCGDTFETNNVKKVYCCTQCQELHRRSSYRPKTAREIVCKVCGQSFESTHPAKKYCGPACYADAKKKRQKEQIHGTDQILPDEDT